VAWDKDSVKNLREELSEAEILWLLVLARDNLEDGDIVDNLSPIVNQEKTETMDYFESTIQSLAEDLGEVNIDGSDIQNAYDRLINRSFTDSDGNTDSVLWQDKPDIVRLTYSGNDLINYTLLGNEEIKQELRKPLVDEEEVEEETEVWFPDGRLCPEASRDAEAQIRESDEVEIYMEIRGEKPDDVQAGGYEREVIAKFPCENSDCEDLICHSYMVRFWEEAYTETISVRCDDCGKEYTHKYGDPCEAPT
jgi:hypothetical protein